MTKGENEAVVVLVTGTTGALGSYILASLLRSPNTKLIYALNRKPPRGTLVTAQQNALNDRGIGIDISAERRVRLLEGQAQDLQFGLSHQDWQEVTEMVIFDCITLGLLTDVSDSPIRELDYTLRVASRLQSKYCIVRATPPWGPSTGRLCACLST